MELKDMHGTALALLLIAILVAIGLSILGSMSVNVRTATAMVADRFNATNESCTSVSHTYIDSSTVTYINGSTDKQEVSVNCFTWDNSQRFMSTCVRLANASGCGRYRWQYINASYTYGADNKAQSSIDTGVTAVSTFPNWFGIIIVVIVASIIIGIVIRSFGKK